MASNLPEIEESVINDMFNEISNMEVMLDQDPLEFGPRRLNSKTADTRDFLTRCEKMFVQVSHWLQVYKRAHRSGQLDFDLAMQDMLANDPEVRAGRNVADRNAIAIVKMRDEKEDLDKLQVTIQDLDAVMTVIKSKRADLKDVQSRLRDQKNLCQEEIHLGAKWGSKIYDGAAKDPRSNIDLDNTPVVDSVTMRDLQNFMSMADEVDVSDIPVPFVSEPTLTIEVSSGGLNIEATETLTERFLNLTLGDKTETPLLLNKTLKVEDLPKSAPEDEIDDFLSEIDTSEPKAEDTSSTEVSIDDLLSGF